MRLSITQRARCYTVEPAGIYPYIPNLPSLPPTRDTLDDLESIRRSLQTIPISDDCERYVWHLLTVTEDLIEQIHPQMVEAERNNADE